MSIRDIGPLQGADEGLNHQIVDTFATIAQSDYAWTEKVWVSIAKADGSIQANLGLGKYPNRGVIDGFGGVSRGREQWTVRGSRELRSAPEETAIGPINYEILDPLGTVRVRLDPNDVQPISFDLVLRGVTPPFFEERNLVRNPKTNRIDVNVIRYHQGGWATGSITVDGERYELTGEDGFGFRDHSWGVRQGVGDDPTDLPSPPATARSHARTRGMMKWTPAFFRRPDGTYYEYSVFLTGGAWNYASAYVNDADGRQDRVRSAEPRMQYDPAHALRARRRAAPRHGQRGGAHDRGRGPRRLRLLPQDRRLRRLEGTQARALDGAAPPRRRAHRRLLGRASTSACSASSATRRSASGRAMRSATGSWRASSPATGPSSASPPTPTAT